MMNEDRKIVLSSQDKVRNLGSWVNKVLKALGIRSAMVSDESMIGDFFIEDDPVYLKEICDNLGFEVKYEDYIVDVAKRLADFGE
jgi:hypothetical protein